MKKTITIIVLVFVIQFSKAQTFTPIIFSEINYNSDSTMNPGNWLELYNKTSVSVDIGGWYIKVFNNTQYSIPLGTTVGAHAYLVVAQDLSKFNPFYPTVSNVIGSSLLDFANNGDSIQLYDGTNTLISYVAYKDSSSWPKGSDGWGQTLELNNYNGDLTDGANWFDGCMFGSPGVAYTPCNPDMVFSEINYNSSPTADAGDWVELHNTTATAVSLNGYSLKDSKDSNIYNIPNGITIPSNGYRVFCNDVGKFLSRHPGVTNVNGPFAFGFKSKGEAIRLYGANGKLIFSVLYDNKTPWPTTPDSGGYTLELLNIQGKMNNAENWFAGCPEGSPGIVYDPFCLNGISAVTNSDFYFSVQSPASNSLVLTVAGIPENTKANISILNLLGQEIYRSSVSSGSNELNIHPLISGIYFAVIHSANKSVSQKFIKE